jgi:excisionase family DNA binding protein
MHSSAYRAVPRCADCGKLATGAIFLPSLANSEYVVGVCDQHDVLGDGEHLSMEAMATSPAPFLAAFDRQHVDGDEALRGWLVDQSRGGGKAVDLLDTKQVASYTGFDVRTIQRWIGAGDLKAISVGNGPKAAKRIRREDLAAFLESSKAVRRKRATVQTEDVF